MSSKRLAYLLTVLIVCGFIATSTAQGQTFGTVLISGTITNPDGTPGAGLEVRAETIPFAPEALEPLTAPSRDDGTFTIASNRGAAKISVGDIIKLTVTNADGDVVAEERLTIADDANTTFAGNTVIIKDINIQLRESGIDVDLEPAALYANGTDEATITVTVLDDGVGVTGDTIAISANKGTVGVVTEVGNGVYTATYTAPLLDLTIPDILNITARSATTGLNKTYQTVLLPVPTTVTVELGKSRFAADTPETTTVTVTVKRAVPVTGENIEFVLSPEVGSVSAVTDNGDGTYTATYTSGGTAGEVTLTATATLANRLDEATIVIDAGPPAAIALSANPTTVTSLGSSTITAMVTDSSSNPVGGLSLTTSSETVSEFTSTAFDTYTATYTAPMVAMGAEGPETITVSAAGISADITLDLTSEPPIDVSFIKIEGTVYKEDGEVPADGVDVTVTVGSNSPQMDTTDADGSYSVAFVGLGTPAAITSDPVSVVVADANVVVLGVNGIQHGGSQFPLVNDILAKVKAGESVIVNVTTNIVIPDRSVNFLTVEGMVFKEGGTTSAGGGLDVMVTVGSNPPQMDTTDTDGSYSVAFVGLGTAAATTDDPISVVVSDGSGKRGTNPPPPEEALLSNTDLGTTDSATVRRNVETDIKLTSNLLVVEGTVYLKNGDTHVPAMSNLRETDLTVVVTNTTRNLPPESVSVKDDGTYGLVFQSLGGAAVAETGDELTFEVKNEAGEMVGREPYEPYTLEVADLQAARVEKDIYTTVRAIVNTLHVIGDVEELDGSPAVGVQVTLMLVMDGNAMAPEIRTTDAAGGYQHFFLELGTPVAATGDALLVDVLRESDQFHGHAEITLSSYNLVLLNQPIVVDTITLIPPRLELGGLSINPYPVFGTLLGEGDPNVGNLMGLLPFDLTQPDALQGLSGLDLSTLPTDLSLENLIGMFPSGLTQASGLQELVGTGASIPPSLLGPTIGLIGMIAAIALPPEFEVTDKNIALENFGNAITPRPLWYPFADDSVKLPGRWVNGDQLNLYISGAPTIESVTFMLNGSSMPATQVHAGSAFPYTFQLEEELIALFSGGMPTFAAVRLVIDDGRMPIDMMPSAAGVWSAEAMLTPGSKVSYYYVVELTQPYHDLLLIKKPIRTFPLPDPRNLQIEITDKSALKTLLEGRVDLLSTMDPGVRSVFSVPAVDYQQSLWVGTLEDLDDGEYTLDVDVSYRGGYAESITGKTFTVDRMAPTADVALDLNAPGMNAGMYMREDGTYVATGLMPRAALNISAIPGATAEAAAYMFQFARLDTAGNLGTWNPAITMDLPSLPTIIGALIPTLSNLVSNPKAAVALIRNLVGNIEVTLPLTLDPPHRIPMLIRNSQGGALLGRYGLRAVGIDSLLNMDSSRGVGAVVRLVSPDPDVALVKSVQSDFDGNGVIEGHEMQSTSGDVVVFSDSMVTLTVDVIERTMHPLTSIVVEFQQMPGGDWETIAMMDAAMLASTMEMMVNWAVPDLAGLPDRGGHLVVRTVTTNALNVVHPEEVSVAYERRLPPEVLGIYVDVPERHPESDAAQGTITVSAFTQAMTLPDAAAVQLEIRRSADVAWMPLGIVQLADTTVTSHVQIAIIEGLVNAIISGAPTAPILQLYREWTLSVDSVTLEDTITDDIPDASLDDNPYVLRAIAVDTDDTGVTDSFSLDNYSPTAITTVANEIEMVVPREDGSYYVSGLLHESVPDPMLTLTSRTGAHPSAFTGGIALAVNDASGTAVEIPATGFSGSGNYTFTGVFNLASIPNGTYTFMAAAHAADGSPEARIVAMAITVEVGNFTPPDNFADPSVDILSVTNTLGEANSPAGTDAMYPTGFPAIGDKVTATLIVPNVSTGDIDVLIGEDGMSAATMGTLMIMKMHDDNNIVIMIDTSGLDEGMYGLVGTVTKPNGSVPFGLPSIRVDRTGPAVEIVSPLSRHQVTTLPTIQVSYTDASGFDPNETNPMPAVISLTRLADSKAIDINTSLIRMTAAAAGEILSQSGDIVYAHDDPVVGGAYRIEATVTDVLGNESTAEPVEFTVEGVQPTVTIASPLAGQIIDPRQPLIITAAFTGNGEITVTEFQVNGTDVEGTLEDNWLTHTMQPPLVGEAGSMLQRGSDNTISVKTVDAEGRTAAGSATFAVSLDNTAPIISGPVPKGDVTRKLGRVTAVVTDNESNITRIQFAIDDNPLQDLTFSAGRVVEVGKGTEVRGQTNYNFFDAPIGTHTVTLVAESTGGSATLTWEFTIIAPDTTPPQIVTYSPLGIIRTDRPVLAATVSDESGFARDGITLILAGVPGNQGSGRRSSPTSTTVTFTPSIAVTPGPYTARITVIDRYKNRTEAEWQFTVELDETPPAITTISPQGVVRSDKPIISVSASDDMSGVDTIEIGVKGEGNRTVEGLTSVRSDRTSATFTPTAALTSGVYTVDVKLADMSGNKASGQWQFTVELDTIPPSIVITRPTQEHTENRRPIISATYTDNLSGVDADSVTLSLDGTTVTPDAVSETQVTFTSPFDLTFGQHTVTLKVSDMAPTPNTATQEWSFFVERVGIADARNYPNPFEDGTTVAFRLSRQASVSVRIYDFTGRLVAQPITNSLREAGPVEIAWSGDTSAGENLARGVYFCHILMESELEPQSAILKMAIISE